MDAGILRALKTVKNNPYVQYVGLGLAGLVTQKEQCDQQTGKPLKKSKFQLIRISSAVCGIELCYAAETAFVSPILLKLGVPTSLMSMVWCLSPILGFFLVPVMGSLSDRCRMKLGRRRPFIILLSIGIILGLALVPNGEALGNLLGDTGNRTLVHSPPKSSSKVKLEDMTSYSVYNNQHSNTSNSGGLFVGAVVQSDTTTSSSYNDSGGSFVSSSPNRLRGIVLTIIGVAMLDFNCDACQSPCRAYLLDISLPEDHSTGLTMFTVMAGAGGAVGYLMGGIDWNATGFGEAFGGHIRVVFTVVLLAFLICLGSTLTSFREIPLSELNVAEEETQRKKKLKGGKKYRKFTNEDSSASEDDEGEETRDEKLGIDVKKGTETYGSLSKTGSSQEDNNVVRAGNKEPCLINSHSQRADKVDWLNKHNLDSNHKAEDATSCFDTHLTNGFNPFSQKLTPHDTNSTGNKTVTTSSQMRNNSHVVNSGGTENPLSRRRSFDHHCPSQTSNGTLPGNKQLIGKSKSGGFPDEINPYACWTMPGEEDLQHAVPETVNVSTDVTLKTYLSSIVRMPRSLWVLCLCNLFCWMSLVCYSLYFTDFVGQAVFGGDPKASVDSESHIRYDQGVRLGSFGMSLYSLACAAYSLIIEKLVNRFRAKNVYVLGQLVFTVGMAIMAATRHKVAVILLSPSAGIMYATLFTMPYLLVAHYHTRGLFSHGDVPGGELKQVRGLGTDVAIISSMVFLAQFMLSVVMGTLISLVDSTATVMIASSVLSFLGAITATQVTYLDL